MTVSVTTASVPIVRGHAIARGGAALDDDGNLAEKVGLYAVGRAICSCGWRSDALKTTLERRTAYKVHLAEVAKDRESDKADATNRERRQQYAQKQAGEWTRRAPTPTALTAPDGRIEEWRPVADYEDFYHVSSFGRVHSVFGRKKTGGILSPSPAKRGGYPIVHFSKDGKKKTLTVHSLVAAAFLGPRPSGHDIRHLDGDPTNCNVGNLAYGTRTENILDAVRHGTHSQASKTHCPEGHAYDEENTRLNRRGARCCRRCEGWSGTSTTRRSRRAPERKDEF